MSATKTATDMQTEPAAPSDWFRHLPFAARLLLLALFLYLIFPLCSAATDELLRASDFFAWFYGPQQVALARGSNWQAVLGASTTGLLASPWDQGPLLTAATLAPERTDLGREILQTRLSLWGVALAPPFWVCCVALFFRWFKPVSPADIGLTLHDGPRNLRRGLVAAVLLTPPVLGLNYAAAWFFKVILAFNIREHPLSFAGQHGLFPVEWLLLACAVLVSAPLWEELVFRGVLQRLFIEHPWGGHVAMGMALVTALLRQSPGGDGLPFDILSLLSANAPVLFVAALVPFYLLVCWQSKTRQPPAVFATALFFGAIHSFAWPSPIALFVLGLVLGYLALRTRSLVAPIVVHSLFNGVSFVLLITGWGA